MRPGRVLFGGLVVLYLLAYLRGTALLVALALAAVGLLWRRRTRPSSPSAAGGWSGWDATSRPRSDSGATAVLDPDGAWPATTVVQGVPDPLAAGEPGGFAVLVELRNRAGRQAMLQVEAAHPAGVDLERLVHQGLSQAAGRAGWQLQRWQPITDDVFAPAGWDETGGSDR